MLNFVINKDEIVSKLVEEMKELDNGTEISTCYVFGQARKDRDSTNPKMKTLEDKK